MTHSSEGLIRLMSNLDRTFGRQAEEGLRFIDYATLARLDNRTPLEADI